MILRLEAAATFQNRVKPPHCTVLHPLRKSRSCIADRDSSFLFAGPMSDLHAGSQLSPDHNPNLDSAILTLLMDTIPDRIYFKNLESKIVRNNAAHARAFGLIPERCVGKSDFDFFSREHAERAFSDEQEIIRTGKPVIAKTERM